MARFNEIQVGRFNRALQKMLGMKGPASVPQLGTEILPAIAFPFGVELRYLESWERFGALFNQAAGAAATSDIKFRNPVGSNIVAVFEQIVVVGSGPALSQYFIQIGTSTTDYTTPLTMTNGRLDNRTRPTPTLIASRQNNGAGLGSAFAVVNIPAAGGTFSLISTANQEITVLPGDAMVLSQQTVNQQGEVSCVWRERFLEDSERT